MQDQIILVNELDEEMGIMEKMEAHQKALLHRAFSVFIFDKEKRMLLQQRASTKYHSPNLWTNTCCSHPKPGEKIISAAKRRLFEEMGFQTELKKMFHFTYKHRFENGLTEHEFDHVLIGIYDGDIHPSQEEVADCKFMDMSEIENSLKEMPDNYTPWFHIAFPLVKEWIATNSYFFENQ